MYVLHVCMYGAYVHETTFNVLRAWYKYEHVRITYLFAM